MALHEWDNVWSEDGPDDWHSTRRMPVPGGWIYLRVGSDGAGMAFVPEAAASRITNDEAVAEVIEAARSGLECMDKFLPPGSYRGQQDLQAALANLDT